MLGAIIGDICGSIYEFDPVNTNNFILMDGDVRFTDDTVLTIATADCILNDKEFATTYKEYANNYPLRGYGMRFQKWVWSKSLEAYGSYGNGSAMRVSAVGFYYNTIEEVLENARKSAEVTHNHIEGIKGAQAIALAIFLARTDHSKEQIKNEIEKRFYYNLSRSLESINKDYRFNETCQGTVPEAIIAFLESTNFESAIKNAILLRGDADTQACMAGAIAEAFYKEIPEYLKNKALEIVPKEFTDIMDKLYKTRRLLSPDDLHIELPNNIINIIICLIDRVKNNSWCFKYGGACSTCGMKDIKKYLKNTYTFDEIINAFEQLDYSRLDDKYQIGVKKIYSLITGQYSVYRNKFDFKEFEHNLLAKWPNNIFVSELLACNDKTYWQQWQEKQKINRQIEKEIATKARTRRNNYKIIAQEDHKLRNSKYRDDLIDELFKMDMDKRIKYLAQDTKHTIKFYPSKLLIDAEGSFDCFNRNDLELILRKLFDLKFKKGPWKEFKRKLRFYLYGSRL